MQPTLCTSVSCSSLPAVAPRSAAPPVLARKKLRASIVCVYTDSRGRHTRRRPRRQAPLFPARRPPELQLQPGIHSGSLAARQCPCHHADVRAPRRRRRRRGCDAGLGHEARQRRGHQAQRGRRRHRARGAETVWPQAYAVHLRDHTQCMCLPASTGSLWPVTRAFEHWTWWPLQVPPSGTVYALLAIISAAARAHWHTILPSSMAARSCSSPDAATEQHNTAAGRWRAATGTSLRR
jgi:hypothetical protein